MNTELIVTIVSRLIVLLIALPIHETAHAYISYKLGDPTAKMLGRLSLNPINHIDPMGAVSMMLVGIGWAKPVPIDPRYYKNRKGGMALSALAGPMSNLILAYFSMIITKVFLWLSVLNPTSDIIYWAYYLFYMMTIINISLCIFNLIPIPPFDGSRIFGVVLPEKWYFGIMKYERYILVAIFALLWSGLLDTPLSVASTFIFNLLDNLSGFADTIMSKIIF